MPDQKTGCACRAALEKIATQFYEPWSQKVAASVVVGDPCPLEQENADLRAKLGAAENKIQDPQVISTHELCGGTPLHEDDNYALMFCSAMRDKLRRKREQGYGGWNNTDVCSPGRLAELLIGHLQKGDPVDIGNFAMMLYFRLGGAVGLAERGKQIVSAEQRAERAEAERDAARKALEPFAAIAKHLGPGDSDSFRLYEVVDRHGRDVVTWGDFRAAAAVLANRKGDAK